MADDEVQYAVDIDLGNNGGHVRFRDASEAQKWIDKESEYWNSILSTTESRNLKTHQLNSLNHMRNLIKNWVQNQTPSLAQNVHDSLQAYTTGTAVHSSTPSARAIKLVQTQSGNHAALVSLAYATGINLNYNDPKTFSAIVQWVLFAEGFTKKTTAAVRRSLDDLAKKMQSRDLQDEKHSHTIRTKLDGLLSEYDSSKTQFRRAGAKQFKKARNTINQEIIDTRQKLKDHEEFYRNAISLQTPVSYWAKRRCGHRIGAIVTILLTIAYLGFVIKYSKHISLSSH